MIAERVTVRDKGRIRVVGTVDGVRKSGIPRVMNLLSRTAEEQDVDAEEYLHRLTGVMD